MALTTEVFAKCLEIQIQSLQNQLALLRGAEDGLDHKVKKKKVVDPNKPKRAHNAYQLYMMDVLPKLKSQFPDKIQKELMTMAANQWSHLDDDSKKMFVDAAARDKEEFQRKLTIYNESNDHPNPLSNPSSGHTIEISASVVSEEAISDANHHKKKKKKDKKRKSDVESNDDASKQKRSKKEKK